MLRTSFIPFRELQRSGAVSRVQVMPDWTDTARKRWVMQVERDGASMVRTFSSEQDARMGAFLFTGVGDFLCGITWVRATDLPTLLDTDKAA
jgi:hypothetical protein